MQFIYESYSSTSCTLQFPIFYWDPTFQTKSSKTGLKVKEIFPLADLEIKSIFLIIFSPSVAK